MLRASRRLAFLERAEHLAALPGADHYTIIALHPRVSVEADIAGVEYRRPEDYVDDDTLETLGLGNFTRVQELCAALDRAVHETVGDTGIDAASWSFYWLKMLFDAISLRTHQIDLILEHEAPAKILCFQSPPAVGSEPVPSQGSLYASVIEAAAARRGIIVESLASPAAAGAPRAARAAGFIRSARARAARARRSRFSMRRQRGRQPKVICITFDYNIPKIAAELERQGHRFAIWPNRPPAQDEHLPRALWDRISVDRSVRELFVWDGVDLWSAAEPHLRRVVSGELAAAVEQHAAALEVLERLAPDVLLTSGASTGRENAICAAARRASIPSVLSRHGAVGLRGLPMGSYVDLADWALCWGECEAEWVERLTGGRVKPVVVGSPMIERTAANAPARSSIRRRLGIGRDEPVILYAPTSLSGQQWYANRRAPSDGRYFDQQKQILAALAALPVRVVVKEHPGEEEPSALSRWSAHLYGSDVLFLRQPPFHDLVHLANAVVIDAPFTSLVEALVGSAHLYVVDHPVIDWSPGVVDHLRAHGVRICPTEELAELIGREIATGKLDSPAKYGPAAREPLAAGGAGEAAARAASAIVTILRGNHPRSG